MLKQKLILTHWQNLHDKYANKSSQTLPYGVPRPEDNLDRLLSKLSDLITFDFNRGIETQIVYLDTDPRLNGKQVTDPLWFEDFKNAVDEAYKQLRPDYMMILGSNDIVPFIPLRDPCIPHSGRDVPEHYLHIGNIPSDLPYACDQICDMKKPETYKAEAFQNPTRVISRCPDVEGDADMGIQVLLRTLDQVINMSSRPATDYHKPWAVCTPVRRIPIGRVLEMMYGTVGTPHARIYPSHRSGWTNEEYSRIVHVHIVHGARQRNLLYGERSGDPITYPPVIRADCVDSNVTPGTVVLERACFGGQLYDPHNGHTKRSPLVNMYLSSGAACMIGSTVPAFSNPHGVLLGDYLIAKFFEFLDGRTIGEAFLMTRQWLMSFNYPQLRCSEDARMFAAFQLYGDVSAIPMSDVPHPVFAADADSNWDVRDPNAEDQGADSQIDSDHETDSQIADDHEADGSNAEDQGDDNHNYYPMEADEKIKLPKEVDAAIRAYLLSEYQIKSVDFISCHRLMENGKIIKGILQFTAYTQEIGIFEEIDPEEDYIPAEEPDNPDEIDLEDDVPEEMKTRFEENGARFVFQSPGKTPEEPVEFLWGYTAN